MNYLKHRVLDDLTGLTDTEKEYVKLEIEMSEVMDALGEMLRIHYALNKGSKSLEVLKAKRIHEKYK